MSSSANSTVVSCEEIWKPVPSPFEDIYHISNLGRLKRVAKGHLNFDGESYIIRPSKSGYKRYYHTVTLSRGRVNKNYSIHFLVAITFIGPIPEGKIIDHIDDNSRNNRWDNLQFITQAENIVKGILRTHESDTLDRIAELYLSRRQAKISIEQQES